eukprot:CAMPEP_0172312734 /NCGR_PEP_ID=MMETSP1058-20130122/18533_1 /TAXON_ID=83371 /ORGANISM="Detonula confervacea, Strain CCMP 353" /LENGTH=257 /DNA_ID=CAMNT_0013026277 /DNA_START=44 /DNA_END=814 /DNA_ORIENTATION=-
MIASIVIVLAISWRCAAFHSPLLPATIGGNYQSTKRFRGKSCRSSTSFMLKMSPSDDVSNNNGSDEIEKLRQTASKLRAEVQAAEKALQDSRGTAGRSSSTEATQYTKPVECLDLNDSCWEITYRFANEPVSNNDDDEGKNKNKPQRKSYGGKLQLQFRGDGYTDILSPLGETDTSSSSSTANFPKLWGWDLETSAEDELDYILFSADVILPPPISSSERFYFQARIDREGKNKDILLLNDGSVTVKRNVEAPGGGW